MIHSGWPVTGDFFWLQRDPVPLHHGSVFFFNFIFKDAAVVHNAFGRSSIFLLQVIRTRVIPSFYIPQVPGQSSG